jgi:hypothetical protein
MRIIILLLCILGMLPGNIYAIELEDRTTSGLYSWFVTYDEGVIKILQDRFKVPDKNFQITKEHIGNLKSSIRQYTDNLESLFKFWEEGEPAKDHPRYQEIIDNMQKLENGYLALDDRSRTLNQKYLNEVENRIKYELSELSPEQLFVFSVLNKQQADSLKKYFLDKKDNKITKAYGEILNHVDFIDPNDFPVLFQRLSVNRLARTYPVSAEIISSNISNLISDRLLGIQSGAISNKYIFYGKMSYNNFTLQQSVKENGAVQPKLSGYSASFGFDRDVSDSNFLLGLLYSYSIHDVEYQAYKDMSRNITDRVNSNFLYAYFSMPFSSISFNGKVGGGISNLSLANDRTNQKGWIFDTKGSMKYTKNFSNFLIDFIVPECSFLSYSYKKDADNVVPGVEGLALTDDTKGKVFSIATGFDMLYFAKPIAPKITAKVKYSKYLPDSSSVLSNSIDLSGTSIEIGGGAVIEAPNGILDIVGSYNIAKRGGRGFSCSVTAKLEL